MGTMTYFVALPFERSDEGELRPGEAQECQSANAAIRCAQGMAKIGAGAIAFSRSGDPSSGEFAAAEVLRQFGEVPAEEALLGYE